MPSAKRNARPVAPARSAAHSPARPPGRDPARPPGPSLARLRRDASRLRAEAAALVGAVPAPHRAASALARWLGVDRSLCSRLLAAARCQGDDLEVFAALPGVDGLVQVARAAASRGIDKGRIARLLAAAEVYRAAVGVCGGSQAKLVRFVRAALVESSAPAPGPAPWREHRGEGDAARHAATELTGLHAHAYTLIYAVQPVDGRAGAEGGLMTAAAVHGLVHLRRAPGHMPVVLSRQVSPEAAGIAATTLDPCRQESGSSPTSVIGRLSTDPFPAVTVSRDGPLTMLMLDPAPDDWRPLDVYVGSRFAVTAPDRHDSLHCVSIIPRVPSDWSVMDIHIHRDLEIIEAEASLMHVGGGGPVLGDPARRWHDRLCGPAPRVVPSTGVEAWGPAPRHREAADELFHGAGWDASEFRHWRVEMRSPPWGVQQCVRMKVRV